jgi:uncharacterized protein YbjT (DUF2867 family)
MPQALASPCLPPDSRRMSTLLSLGHGYSARALARRLVPQGWRIIGTTRNPAKADQFRTEGVEPFLWPGDLEWILEEATHILCSAAPDAKGVESGLGRLSVHHRRLRRP